MSQAPIPEERPEGEVLEPIVSLRHDPYAAWRFRDFRFIAIGAFIAAFGSQMQTAAVFWQVKQWTNLPKALGWVGLVQALPILLFCLPAGYLADRMDRKRIISVALVVTIFSSLALAWVSYDEPHLEWVYALLFVNAIARAVIWPASASLWPLLVPKSTFSNAVTWRSTGFQIASVAGPAVGGFVLGLRHGASMVFVTDAMLTIVYLAFVAVLRPRPQENAAEEFSLKTLLVGLKHIYATKVVFAAITLDLFAVLLGGATALLPFYAEDVLHVGSVGFGFLNAAPAMGAVCMAVMLAHRPPMQSAGQALLWAVAGFGVVTIVFGMSHWFWLSMLMLAFSGALDNISVVVRHSLVQLRTPDAMRGRVSAVNSIFISSSNDLGGFRAGQMAQWLRPTLPIAASAGAIATANGIGAERSVVFGGIATILVVLVAAALWPEIRRLGRLHEEEKAAKGRD